ncbi:MAG: BREX system Lon protease-like protein BrxL [Herpetosiphonaceae bacterium]|nr:BREX system Lon protease-like protein BrxL [Herpetosiphonaceae bacterium]
MTDISFHIAPRYLRSINLQRDYSEQQIGLAGYQATPLVLQTITRITQTMNHPTRAFSLIGPYGVGKSAFGVFLAHYFSRDPKGRTQLVQQHAVAGVPSDFSHGAPVLHPILVGGNNTSLRQAILHNAVQSLAQLNYHTVELKALSATMQEAAEDPNIDPLAVASLLEQTTQLIAQSEAADGIVLVIDELGQYLNYVARQEDERDLFVLQTIAEMAARSGTLPFVIVTILHQSFDLYTGTAGVSQRTEWAKVQGRFTELPFQEPSAQMLQMIGHALCEDDPLVDDRRRAWADKLAPLADQLKLRPPDINIDEWHKLVARSYPLHPMVLIALPLLFRQLAQNERSLFAFLTSYEPWGLQDFLSQSTNNSGVYWLYHLYNYIEANLGAGLFGRARGQRWAELAEARVLLEDTSPLLLEAVTTIGTLGALGQSRGLHANLEQISFALRDTAEAVDVSGAIDSLELRRQIVFRKYRGSYILFEGSDLDIDALVQDARHQINSQTTLINLLQEYTNTLPLIARQFSYQTGAIRHFSVQFVDAETVGYLPEEKTEADGIIWYVVASDTEAVYIAHQHIINAESIPHHIVVLPQKVHVLRDLLVDVASLRWILEHQPELESDRVARRELAGRLAEAEQLVAGAISRTYGPGSAQWFWRGDEISLRTSRDLDHLLSKVCEVLFPYTPRIWNELIVRRQLSAMASKARRNLVEAMLEHGNEETLGITGFPAERAVYESVLRATGIHRIDAEDQWYFGPPSEKDPGGLQDVWNAIQHFFESSTEQSRALTELYTLLEHPPFGVKAGLIPLLFVAGYLANIGEIALYEYGNFAPIPDMALFERLLRQPTNFSVRLSRTSGLRVAVYERLAHELAPSAIGKTFQPAVMDVIKPLLRIARKLPDYTRQTNSVSGQTQAVRTALLNARSPDEMLFNELPQACGFPPILVDQTPDDDLVEGFFMAIQSSLQELQGAYEKLLLQINRLIGEVCVNKALVQQAGFGTRSIPAFVSEWIVTRHAPDGVLDDTARNKIRTFLNKHLPTRDQKQQLKAQLQNGETLTILDQFSVSVDLKKNENYVIIPCLDETKAGIERHLIDQYPLLLGGGVWGVGKLYYTPPNNNRDGQIMVSEFRPMQNASLDLDLLCERRAAFALDEWRDLLISSMGYNPEAYSIPQQMHLLTRLVPLVQERINMIELAPKGTGKSFVFLNLSRYARLVSGGKVTAAALFYNNATRQPGLLSNYDLVIFDEAQSLSFDNPGEIIGVLKDYLESGSFARGGTQKVESSAGLMMLANIPLDEYKRPRHQNLFLELPSFLGETAFIDRIHGILPGWELPRIEQSFIATGIGFKADYFGDVLHGLRHRAGYEQIVAQYNTISGTNDRRDLIAISRLASGFCKLLFPHGHLSSSDFAEYCLKPAVQLRQRVRDQLKLLDPEYPDVRIGW